MAFPGEVTFALENVTYKATLVKNEDIAVAASATTACIICGGALGGDAFYRTDPVIFQVHAECAMKYGRQLTHTRGDSKNFDSLLTSSHPHRYCKGKDVPFHNPNTNYYSTPGSHAASPQQPQHVQGLVNPMNPNYSEAYRPYLYPPPQQQQQQQHLQGLGNPIGHYYPPYPYPPPQQPQHLQGLVNPMNPNYSEPYRPYLYPPPQQQQQQHLQGLGNPIGHYYPPYAYPPPQQTQPQSLGNSIGHYYSPYPYPHPSPSQHPQNLGNPNDLYYPPPQQQQHSQGLWNSLGNAALVAFSNQLFHEVLQGLSF